MAQVASGFEQTPFNTFKTKGLPRVLPIPWSRGSELQPTLTSTQAPQEQHRKTELVLLQAKKHDVHLLSKLSPYFRSCVSQELLKTNWYRDEKLPSLCYSCNRTLDRRHEQTISFNRIKLKRRAFPGIKDEHKEYDMHEHLTTSSPWKYNYREQQFTSQNATSCIPFQRFEKEQSFALNNKQCLTRSSPLILPEVIKITPQKKTTPRQKTTKVHDVGLVPPPTPTIRYLRDLSPELRSLFVIRLASGSSPLN